jgi:hypothetical protein
MRISRKLGLGAWIILSASVLLLLAGVPEETARTGSSREQDRAPPHSPARAARGAGRNHPPFATEAREAGRTTSGEEEPEYDDAMNGLVRSVLAGDELLARYWDYRGRPLMYGEDRAAHRELLSDPAMYHKVRQDLLHPEEAWYAAQRDLQQLIEVDYLRDAAACQDNPLQEELLDMVEDTILEDNFAPGLDASVRRTIATVKMELYEILYDHAPRRAEAVVEQARGTRLEALLAFAAEEVRRRRQTRIEVERRPQGVSE